ncbi:hypothetical protein [Enterobacter cloacae]|uniref:hypothetical protein n=1 Tax=Enterobacter cloacae TaxID=550 RepID=UPI003F4876F0
MSNIDKRDGQVQRYANFGVDMMEWADGGYVKYSDYVALLDELEAKDRRIAELSHHLQSAHAFIEHTEAFGHEASNGILCCGDAQWNIDASKSALAAAGKGE